MDTKLDPVIDNYFSFIRSILTAIGTWPFSSTILQARLKIARIVIFILLASLVLSAEFYKLADKTTDIFVITEGICVAVTAIIAMIKNIVAFINKEKLKEILIICNELYINTPVELNADMKKKFINTKKYAHNITRMLLSLFVVVLSVYAIFPWIRYYIYHIKVYPYPSKFPFETDSWSVYISLYVLEIITGIGVITIFSGDTLFAVIILLICSRLDVLEVSITTATREARKFGKRTELFDECVKYHQKILRICEIMEYYYSPILVTQFLFSTIVVCMLCFLSTQVVEMDKNLMFISYFLSMVGQLFIFCYFGQLLETKKEWLTDETFYLPWYCTPVLYQRDFKFFIMRGRRKTIFSAYNFMPCNLPTFFKIFKTSMSYYTLLLSMKDKTN